MIQKFSFHLLFCCRSARGHAKPVSDEEEEEETVGGNGGGSGGGRDTSVRMYEKERDHLYNNIVESLRGLETLRKQVREERLAAGLGRLNSAGTVMMMMMMMIVVVVTTTTTTTTMLMMIMMMVMMT